MSENIPSDVCFDSSLFGVLLRQARRKAGYAKAEDFCAALSDEYGVNMGISKLYRIENGKQQITVNDLVASAALIGSRLGCSDVSSALLAIKVDKCCSVCGAKVIVHA